MTKRMRLWQVIAKSPLPMNQKQIRAKAKADYCPRTLSKLRQGGYVECKNVDGAKTYTAICSPSRLGIQELMAIAEARKQEKT